MRYELRRERVHQPAQTYGDSHEGKKDLDAIADPVSKGISTQNCEHNGHKESKQYHGHKMGDVQKTSLGMRAFIRGYISFRDSGLPPHGDVVHIQDA